MVAEHPTRYRPRKARHDLDALTRHLDTNDLHELARTLGISHRWARELKATGLTDRQADRFACGIGLHPAALWPTWWDIEPDVEEGDDGIMRWSSAS